MLVNKRFKAVFYKSVKDLMVNRVLLFMSFLFPIMACLFKVAFPPEEAFEAMSSFAMMNCVMIPILSLSTVIAEEKEKNTLKVLMESNVSPLEYLLGIIITSFLTTLISASLFIVLLSEYIVNIPKYLLYASLGIMCSLLIGAIIGILCDNQVKVGSMAALAGMIIGMLPVFAEASSAIAIIERYIYAGSLSYLITGNNKPVTVFELAIFGGNIAVLFAVFYVVYQKKHLVT